MEIDASYNKDIESIRQREFPNLRGETYIEHVGTTLYARSQMEAFQHDLLENLYGNPHSNSPSSCLATDVVDQVRYRILQHFNTSQEEYSVVFTSGCTGALKLLAETFTFDPFSSSNQNNSISLNSENPKRVMGSFIYLLDNHTSVQGMRETMATRTGVIYCLDTSMLDCDLDIKKENKGLIYKTEHCEPGGNNLFAFPAQSNFSGTKYPLAWLGKAHCGQFCFQKQLTGQWYTVLDAASLVCTSSLDLGIYKPDFVTISFYKMFGFPTGIGALLVRNQSAHVLQKQYFGGGTVEVSTAQENFRVFRKNLSDRYEDGTIPFLDIIALRHGFDALDRIGGGIQKISQHAFTIAQYFHHNLSSLHHGNGRPLADIYCEGNFDDIQTQGPIVNFNLRRANGDYIGFAEVEKMAQLYNIHLRTGCFCNVGACQKYLGLSSKQVKDNFQAGHRCGDNRDLIEGLPTGSVRVSFGYPSILKDAQICLNFIVACFQEKSGEKFNFQNMSLKDFRCHSYDHTSHTTSGTSEHTTCLDSSESDFSSEEEFIDCQSETVCHKQSDQSGCLSLSPLEMDHILESCNEHTRRLTGIMVYPVKSCGAMEVKEWQLGERGLLYDREWMIVSESGVVLSQKRETNLCLIQPTLDMLEPTLKLEYPEMPAFHLPLNSNTHQSPIEFCPSKVCGDSPIEVGNTHQSPIEVCTSKVCGDRVNGIDCGDAVADWISVALQRSGCRLIKQTKTDQRTSKLKDSTQASCKAACSLSLANESQYLLISRKSVQVLRDRILERHLEEDSSAVDSQDIPGISNLVGRFRGNLIISGGQAFEEDSWNSIEIGENTFFSQGECGRCQMICVDQSTGQRGLEPLKSLASWRGRKVPFGIHLQSVTSTSSGKLRVGDTVCVLTQK
ncbi:molybdenum cofactor sulfurase-like [Mizuhopecten yessoensis]|uniref:molybdenum cofactor sulfurase-like n=1 Tax=Mizuhopecten yessoensis TaxID=6573 RepID=UPI000B45EB07|nr:molybdenum cofactor sulfurase-like [Mizuhopecten yessoensis]